MGDRPDDDDVTHDPSEMTVPPWLRTGPTPGPATPTRPAEVPPAADAPAPRDEREAAPNRITLGARGEAPEQPGGKRGGDDLSTLPLRGPRGPGDDATPEATGRTPVPVHPATPPGPAARDHGPAARPDPRRTDTPPAPAPHREHRPLGGSAPAGGGRGGGRGVRNALLAVGAVVIVAGSAALGFVLVRGSSGPEAVPTEDTSAVAGGCTPLEEEGRTVGSGPGSLDTQAGAVLAFDHAYYVERSAEQAFEAVAPSSRMSEDRLQTEGIDEVPEGTTHCVDARQLSPTLLEVDLTEFRPDTEQPVLIRQRVRLEEAEDGTWGIVSITPAG